MAGGEDWKSGVLKEQVFDFCKIAKSPSEIAEMFLKKNDYILQACIKLKNSNSIKLAVNEDCYLSQNMKDALCDYFENRSTYELSQEEMSADKSVKKFTLLTWNIDGLDEEDFYLRNLKVAETINSLDPDVVLLQEVIDESLRILQQNCKRYEIFRHVIVPYYCVIMVKKKANLQFISKEIQQYPTSRMGRYLFKVDINFEGRPVSLFTTHLESMKASKNERVRQLQYCLEKMSCIEDISTVILGGDLNLRDEELAKIGGLPQRIKDIWIETGSDVSKEFTWDLELNDNKRMPGNAKPRLRFDRVFYRACKDEKMKIAGFTLVGQERLTSCDRFASDHWGILCEFAIAN